MQQCVLWGRGGITPPIFLKVQESWSKSRPGCKRVGHSAFCDLLLVTVSDVPRHPLGGVLTN